MSDTKQAKKDEPEEFEMVDKQGDIQTIIQDTKLRMDKIQKDMVECNRRDEEREKVILSVVKQLASTKEAKQLDELLHMIEDLKTRVDKVQKDMIECNRRLEVIQSKDDEQDKMIVAVTKQLTEKQEDKSNKGRKEVAYLYTGTCELRCAYHSPQPYQMWTFSHPIVAAGATPFERAQSLASQMHAYRRSLLHDDAKLVVIKEPKLQRID